MSKNILAFSSSRVGNAGFLEKAIPYIREFAGDTALNIAFVPFASVNKDYAQYSGLLHSALSELPYKINLVNHNNAKEVLEQADLVMVGGGNTFKLLHDLYELNLLDIIRDKVDGGTPYIGWSAGSNITGPTISTTNDMPIIEPKSFNALGLLPFQINPHYYDFRVEGFNGETRDQRLVEFIDMNPGIPVVGLPEGTALKYQHEKLTLLGEVPAVLFYAEEGEAIATKREIEVGEDLGFLM